MSTKVHAALGLKSKLLERYAEQIDGILGCCDRVILTGTLVDVAHPDVLTARLSGLSNRRMQAVLRDKIGGQIGRILKRLRLHGLLKKIGKTYKYYLTELGHRALLVGLKLKEHLIVPGLAVATP